VCHVHTEHPGQPIALSRGEVREGAEEAPHPIVVLGPASLVRGAGERTAQDGDHAHGRAVEVLEEDHLELDRVLDRVAVVLETRRFPAGPREAVHERPVGAGLAERRDVGLAGEAEALGLA
jgi:hypothetical protein